MNNLTHELHAITIIALRDFLKFLRDKPRIVATFVFPVIFIGALGGSFQSNLGDQLGFDFMQFVFTGVLGQTLFQSAAAGVISLVEDRKNDFSRELFVSPISRYSIIIGKIFGESIVAMVQGIGIIGFGLLFGVSISATFLLSMLPLGLFVCFLGGAFGILVMANLNNERSANQIFPFILFPQYFLAGVFNPIRELPLVLEILSQISPMRYAIDLVRGVYYRGDPQASFTVLQSVTFNIAIISAMFLIFLFIGTYFFVKNERNK